MSGQEAEDTVLAALAEPWIEDDPAAGVPATVQAIASHLLTLADLAQAAGSRTAQVTLTAIAIGLVNDVVRLNLLTERLLAAEPAP